MLRLAIVGFGSAELQEIQHALARCRGISIQAVVDSGETQIQPRQENVATAYEALPLNELIESRRSDFDAIVWGERDVADWSALEQVARAGKAIFLPVRSLRSIGDLNAAKSLVCSAGIQLMFGGTNRFRPTITPLKQSLENRSLGAPVLLRIHSWSPQGQCADELELAADRTCRLLVAFDLVNWLYSVKPQQLFALAGGEGLSNQDWPRYTQVHVTFPEGASALVSLTDSLPPGDGYELVSLIGSTGAAYADDQYQSQLLYQGGHASAVRTGEGVVAKTAELSEFAAAIASQRDPIVGIDVIRDAWKLIDCARQSLTSGHPVCVE